MTNPYVILVAVDYSTASDLAFERALETASEKASAVVHAVNVMPVYQSGITPDMTAGMTTAFSQSLPNVNEAAQQLKRYVERSVQSFQEKHPGKELPFLQTIVAHQRVDVPSEEVAQLAADLEADLVVVGTHGRRGISRLILGSVAEATVRLAPCPVLVVRAKQIQDTGPAIQPPCPRCLETRKATGGKELWCEQHRERHGQRHTYHEPDSGNDGSMPLVMRS